MKEESVMKMEQRDLKRSTVVTAYVRGTPVLKLSPKTGYFQKGGWLTLEFLRDDDQDGAMHIQLAENCEISKIINENWWDIEQHLEKMLSIVDQVVIAETDNMTKLDCASYDVKFNHLTIGSEECTVRLELLREAIVPRKVAILDTEEKYCAFCMLMGYYDTNGEWDLLENQFKGSALPFAFMGISKSGDDIYPVYGNLITSKDGDLTSIRGYGEYGTKEVDPASVAILSFADGNPFSYFI